MQENRSTKSNHSANNQYFFEVKLMKINITDPVEKPFRISIYKGLQKLDETEPVTLSEASNNLQSMNLGLNFYIPQFDRKTTPHYRITLQNVEKGEEAGSFNIGCSAFIISLVKDNTNSFYRKDKFKEGIQLEYILFVEKTKNDLNQSVRSFEEQNNPQKYDTQPNLSKSRSQYEAMKMLSIGQLSKQSSVIQEPSLGMRQTRRLNESFEDLKQNLNQTSVILTEPRMVQKQSTIVNRKRPYKQGSMQTKLVLLVTVIGIGLLVYFLVAISNNSKELQILRSKLTDVIALNL